MTARATLSYTGGEWKSSALQAVAVGANKLVFQTQVRPPRGITWTNNSDVGILSSGLYAMIASIKVNFVANNSWGIAFGPSSGYVSGDGMWAPEDFGTSTTDVVNGIPSIWLDATSTVSVYLYNNNAAQNTNFARPAYFRIYKVG